MRGLVVHCYGIPFYANWGLTKDRHLLDRRSRILTIDELTAGTLIDYPRYFDWATHSFISPEEVVEQLYIQSRELVDKKKQAIHSQKLSGYMNLFRALFTPYIK
jgi:capsular polysaccharide export protein